MFTSGKARLVKCAAAAAVCFVAACTTPTGPAEIFDPYETTNRRFFANNKAVDRAVLRPVSRAYGTALPEPVRRSAANFALNFDTPRHVVNDVLQGNAEDAVHNLFRFILNSTLGVAGLFDPATSFGLTARESDFGETLHVWGTQEGAYLVLPVFGPSTERDAAGRVIDFALNPLSFVLPADRAWIGPTTTAVDIVDTRYRLGTSIDSILYESADSYAQARTIYLQNRRFQLGASGEDIYVDPYEQTDGQ